ncbi:hypothetical protein C0Q70_17290 [Pomacea canaliculata]|uniref:AIG1-type G domain-containing protein n=1 Tax=Pomacea canaliculata TaxID=400727 RepID=A0A2T7NS95_POMCA|nr:hypothetical protein C0Q70_17290 [Pomacea canaliculata]
MSINDRIFKIPIIGASESGKSTAGNILLGKEQFQVSKANPFISETVAAVIGENDREDRHLLVVKFPKRILLAVVKVLDTPDILVFSSLGGDVIVGRPVFQAGKEIVRTVSYITYVNDTWCQVFDTPGISRPVEEQLRSLLEVTRPGPHAIFYFVRESIATTEDLELFRRFQDFIEENLRQHVKLVAAMDMERVPSVPKPFKDMEYILCEMNKEAKGGQTFWLIENLTPEHKNKLFSDHIKEVLNSTKEASKLSGSKLEKESK